MVTVVVTDTTSQYYNRQWINGVTTPLAGRMYEYDTGDTLHVYVCLADKHWVAHIRYSSSFVGTSTHYTLYRDAARQVLAAIHANEPDIIWDIVERETAQNAYISAGK